MTGSDSSVWTLLVTVVAASVLTLFPRPLRAIEQCGVNPRWFRLAALCSLPSVLFAVAQPIAICLLMILPLWWCPWKRLWSQYRTTLRYALGSLVGASGLVHLMAIYSFDSLYGIQNQFILCTGWLCAILVGARSRENRTGLAFVSYVMFQIIFGLSHPQVRAVDFITSLWLLFLFHLMITASQSGLKMIVSRSSSRWI